MTSNDVLRTALLNTADEFFSCRCLSETEKSHRFSLAYRIRKISIKRLGRKAEPFAPLAAPVPEAAPMKSYVPLRKLSVMILAIITAVFLASAAGASYIVRVRGFNFDVHEKYSDASVDFSMYTIKDSIEEVYRLPDESGYELVYDVPDDTVRSAGYSNGDYAITFVQIAGAVAKKFMVNTENSEVYEVTVDGEAGFILVHHRSDGTTGKILTWIHDGYVFQIMGETEIDMVELAKFIVPEK